MVNEGPNHQGLINLFVSLEQSKQGHWSKSGSNAQDFT